MQRSLSTNIAANIAGRMYTGIAGILLVPVYLHFLGLEKYGLFALLNSYMAIAALLDLGCSAAITREIAKLSATSPDRMRDMVWTASVPYWVAALLIASGIYLGSPWIAAVAIRGNGSVADPEVIHALGLAGFSLTLQLPIFLYTGALAGLQRQDLSNSLTVIGTTLRHGALLLLLFGISNSVATLMIWQAGVAAFTALAAFVVLWLHMPSNHRRPRIRPELLRDAWRFAAGIGGITIFANIIFQSDKAVVGALLPTAEVGHYMLASVIAANLFLISQPISAVAFPRLSQLVAIKDSATLHSTFQKLCQLLAMLLPPVATTIAVFPEQAILVWTGNAAVAASVAPLIRLLAIGISFSAWACIPAGLLLATGRTRPLFAIAAAGCAIMLPLVYFATSRFGAPGTAAAMCFYFCFAFVAYAAMLRTVLGGAQWWQWLSTDVALPQGLIAAVALTAAASAPHAETKTELVVILAATWAACSVAAGLAMPWTRREGLRQLRRFTSLVSGRLRAEAGITRQ